MNSENVMKFMPGAAAGGTNHALLRIFQVFVNVEGIRMRKRGFMRLITLLSRRSYGFYAVMLIAAAEDSKPPLLLSLAQDTLMDEFAPLSHNPPETWQIQLVDWRLVGMPPPLFQDFCCVDKDWGAAWYDMADEKARQHRYRLTKLRLWQGKRARHPMPKERKTSAQAHAD